MNQELNKVINDTDSIGDLDEGHDHDLHGWKPFGNDVDRKTDPINYEEDCYGDEVEDTSADSEELNFG